MKPRRRPIREALLWYFGTIAVVAILIAVMLATQGLPRGELVAAYGDVVRQLGREGLFWIALWLPYGLFIWLRSPIRVGLERGALAGAWAGLWRVVLPVALVIGAHAALRARATAEEFAYEWDRGVENTIGRARDLHGSDGKQRGVHLFARELGPDVVVPLVRNNVEWLVHVPFAWQEEIDRPGLHASSLEGVDGRVEAWLRPRVELGRSVGMKSMLKPHVMVRNGWRGAIDMRSDDDWRIWFDEYRAIVLELARLAEELEIEQLCVGTELTRTVTARPDDWRALIAAVRRVYGGDLVYAANWDDPLEEIPFWSELDYIGVQAYFPLADGERPGMDELVSGWSRHLERLAELSARHGRAVLFTELGYKSVPAAASAPWEWLSVPRLLFAEVSVETQLRCYEAFFRAVWEEEWFAGVHLWKWGGSHESAGGVDDPDFTPQNKPAENEIARGFGRVVSSR